MKDQITPWVAPHGASALLVGGSFDPVHTGHLHAALSVRETLPEPDRRWLVFVPASRSPHKPDAPSATGRQRSEMLALAIRDTERAAVWTDEFDRADDGEPGFWVDTLRRARAVAGENADLRFLIGDDQARAFHRWASPREILELASPVVVVREHARPAQDTIEAIEDSGFWTPDELAQWRDRITPIPVLEASSTAIRESLTNGVAASQVEGLDPRVAAYISGAGLYSERDGSGDH